MKGKTIKFDLSADKLLDIAEAKLDEEKYLSALRFLHKSIELYGPAADEYADLAEAYEGIEVYEEAIDCWFQFLDLCTEEEAVDAYEGLAACYYNLGNETQAMIYYKKMITDKYFSPENNLELSGMFEKEAEPPSRFHVSWPPQKADHSGELGEGLRLLREGQLQKAEELFEKVPESSQYYIAAQNYLAVTCLLEGDSRRSEEVCQAALKYAPDNIQLLSTYAAVLSEQERHEEGRAVAERLAAMETDVPDELYKIATVCCENHLYEEALKKFRILSGSVRYDRTLSFFKGVAALRCGKIKESLAAFGTLLDVWPDAEVVRFYYDAVREFAEGRCALPEIGFFYRLPSSERETRVKFLKALYALPEADLRAYCRQSDITALLRWCFDELDGQSPELQFLAVAVAERGDLRTFLADLLLKSTVNDVLKIETVMRICLRNRPFECGIVLSNDYKKIGFDKLRIGRKKHKVFVKAYAQCFARFALLGNGSGEDYRLAAQKLYAALESTESLDAAAKAEDVAASLYLSVQSFNKTQSKEMLRVLHADPHTVAIMQRALAGLHEKDSEVAAADNQTEGDNKDETDRL